MSYYPQARISLVDHPKKHWYQITTNFGQTGIGVNLYGHRQRLSPGQSLTVFQVGNEFGFLPRGDASYSSQLKVPSDRLAEVAGQAPASLAMAYLAMLANNQRVYYVAADIIHVDDLWHMTVEGKDLPQQKLKCVISTQGFFPGTRCLVELHPHRARIIGWWQSLPTDAEAPDWWEDGLDWLNDPEYGGDPNNPYLFNPENMPLACAVGRPPYTYNADYTIYQNPALYPGIRKSTFRPPFPGASNMAFVTTPNCQKDDEYLFSKVRVGINFGAILYTYHIKWHRKKMNFEEITLGEYDAASAAAPPISVTDDGFYWRYIDNHEFDGKAGWCCIDTDPSFAFPRAVFPVGAGTQDKWFPVAGFPYGEIK